MHLSILEKLDIKGFFSQGQCSYSPERESLAYAFSVENMPSEVYEAIISRGFRRCGVSFYRNLCLNCRSCIPIRVDVQKFKPSKSQRRVLRKNQDVRITRHPVSFDHKGFLLYRKYCAQRHDSVKDEDDYIQFLIESPVPTEMMRYYVEGHLIGIGWTDILPNSLSSVYFAFDPDHSFRRPGVFSLLKELELCRTLQKRWLQLGFWIEDNHKMSYKNQYKPCQILVNDDVWQEFV